MLVAPYGGRYILRMSRLRYTKGALLVFGLGLVAGFVVVVGDFTRWGRAASALMALGLVALPAALFADGHGMRLVAWIAARLSRKKKSRKPRAKARRAAASRASRPASARRAPRRSRGRA